MTLADKAAVTPQWPTLPQPRRTHIRSMVVGAAVSTAARRLHIRVEYPDGRVVGHVNPTAPVMRLANPVAVCRRYAAAGPIGLGESYQSGEWDADDLPLLLTTMARHLAPPPWLLWLRRCYGERTPPREDNSVRNAAENVRHHYDLSNSLFAAFLDETMTYSCALFETDDCRSPIASPDLLADAQRRKIDRILDLAGVDNGTRLLEIGCGWGALAVAAARRGAQVHAITVSQEQYRYTQQRAAEFGVGRRVTVELCDYRRITPAHSNGYNAIVSVEMLEAVGEAYWSTYFEVLNRLLAPNGRIALQVITTSHERMLASRRLYTWIHKYIFPGGLIPSLTALQEACGSRAGLRMTHTPGFGAHYAATLEAWRERLDEHEQAILALGFNSTFLRTWRLYLCYSEAGFRSGILDVHNLVLDRPE